MNNQKTEFNLNQIRYLNKLTILNSTKLVPSSRILLQLRGSGYRSHGHLVVPQIIAENFCFHLNSTLSPLCYQLGYTEGGYFKAFY